MTHVLETFQLSSLAALTSLMPAPPTPPHPTPAHRFPTLRALDLSKAHPTPHMRSELQQISSLSALTSLTLAGRGCSGVARDDLLAAVAALTRLASLTVRGCHKVGAQSASTRVKG